MSQSDQSPDEDANTPEDADNPNYSVLSALLLCQFRPTNFREARAAVKWGLTHALLGTTSLMEVDTDADRQKTVKVAHHYLSEGFRLLQEAYPPILATTKQEKE